MLTFSVSNRASLLINPINLVLVSVFRADGVGVWVGVTVAVLVGVTLGVTVAVTLGVKEIVAVRVGVTV